MASIVQIAVQARSQAAAALRAAQQQVNGVTNAVRQSGFTNRQHTRTVRELVGVYRDANGQWYDAQGNMVRSAYATRTVTTAYGRLVNRIQNANNALARFIALSRMAASAGGRMAMASAPYALMAAKIIAVVGAMATLLGVTGNILGATQLIAPAVIAAATGMAVFKMALSGVGDALKAGISGDTKEFAEALKKLHPAAASTVRTLVDLRREWKSTQLSVQGAFFSGARDDIIAMSRALQPVADRWLPKVATAFANARHALRYVFTEAAKSGQLDKIMSGVHRFFSGLMSAVAPLGRAFLDVAEVASGAFGDIGVGIGGAAQKFADWIREMKNSGKLQEWLDKAMHSLGQIKEIAGNVGEMLGAIFGAASDEGENFLEKLNRITQKMADWMNSSDGQELISNLASIIEMVAACEWAFKAVATTMSFVYDVASNAWAGVKAIVGGVVMYILGAYEWLLSGAARAFSWIPGIGPKLQAASQQFQQWKNQVNQAINGIQKNIDISVNYRARWIGNHLVRGGEQSGTYDGLGGRASGGPGGSPKQINEWGPEIVDFAKGMVYNANQSKRMQAQLAGGGGGMGGGASFTFTVAGGRSATNPFADAVLAMFRSGDLRLIDSGNRPIRAARR